MFRTVFTPKKSYINTFKYLGHLKVTKVLLLPLVPKDGTPLKKTTFPPKFCNEICTIYVWTIKNHNSAKKKKKIIKKKKKNNVVPFQNGGQITDFYSASFRFWPKFEKPLSQRNFFNEIWLKVGKHEYIYIIEITLKKNDSVLKWGQNNFLILHNYANLC